MSMDHWFGIALFALVSSITPGPNNVMILASGLNFGFIRSLPHSLGIAIGFGVMLVAVGSGLHSVLETYPWAYPVMRWLGAGYLLWMAWGLAHAKAPQTAEKAGINQPPPPSQPLGFMGAAAFQWINPKAWFMAVTAVTAYGIPGAGIGGVVIIALLFAAICLPCVFVWAGFGVALRRALQNPKHFRQFNISMALALVASLYPLII